MRIEQYVKFYLSLTVEPRPSKKRTASLQRTVYRMIRPSRRGQPLYDSWSLHSEVPILLDVCCKMLVIITLSRQLIVFCSPKLLLCLSFYTRITIFALSGIFHSRLETFSSWWFQSECRSLILHHEFFSEKGKIKKVRNLRSQF